MSLHITKCPLREKSPSWEPRGYQYGQNLALPTSANLNQQPHQSSFPKTKHSGLRAGTCAVPSAWEPEMSPPCVRFPPVPDGKRVPCLHCFPPHHLVSFFRGTLSLPDVSSSSVKAKTVSTSPPLHPQHLDNVSRWPWEPAVQPQLGGSVATSRSQRRHGHGVCHLSFPTSRDWKERWERELGATSPFFPSRGNVTNKQASFPFSRSWWA